MAKPLREWIETDVAPYRDLSIREMSETHFFRDPSRPTYSDLRWFFSPADGIILYQRMVAPDEPLVNIKGAPYSLREALRDPSFDRECMVVGIFMTFYDVHVNRIPYPGRLSYRELDALDTYNHPMLDLEAGILDDLRVSTDHLHYLRENQRVVNRIDSIQYGSDYYVLQIADYDVDSITPFELKQNRPCDQGHRFSQIRYGSQVDLIVPRTDRFDLLPVQSVGDHVEAGMDPLIEVRERPSTG